MVVTLKDINIECIYCHSMNTPKIGTASRMTSTAMFGLASKKNRQTMALQ